MSGVGVVDPVVVQLKRFDGPSTSALKGQTAVGVDSVKTLSVNLVPLGLSLPLFNTNRCRPTGIPAAGTATVTVLPANEAASVNWSAPLRSICSRGDVCVIGYISKSRLPNAAAP